MGHHFAWRPLKAKSQALGRAQPVMRQQLSICCIFAITEISNMQRVTALSLDGAVAAACGTASADNAAPPDAPSIYLAPPRRASARTTRSQITRPVKVGCRTAAWSCKSAAATGAAAPRAYRIGGSPHGEPQTSDTTSPGIMTRGVWGQWQRRRQSNHRDLRPDRLLLHYLVQMIYQFGFITSSRPMRVKSLVTIC